MRTTQVLLFINNIYLLSSDLTARTGLSNACLTAGVGPVLTISGLNAL
jgi:hypothetical protein